MGTRRNPHNEMESSCSRNIFFNTYMVPSEMRSVFAREKIESSSQYTQSPVLVFFGDVEEWQRRVFNSLANNWERETQNISSIEQIVLHDAYQRIIGMGRSVVPFILERLHRSAEMWFPALASITGQDPVPEERQGDIEFMRQAWLEWGRRNVPN